MIKAEELRIGNWLEYKGKTVQVESIDPLKELKEHGLKCSVQIKEWLTDVDYTYNGKWLNRFNPIPLTTEWLERCWFEIKMHEKGIRYIEVNSYLWLLLVGDDKMHMCLASAEWMHDLQARAQYVHQLQNLYFALTGEELTINDPVTT